MTTITREQFRRSDELHQEARKALERLSEERLNLTGDEREALNEALGALETFDGLRVEHPIKDNP